MGAVHFSASTAPVSCYLPPGPLQVTSMGGFNQERIPLNVKNVVRSAESSAFAELVAFYS